MRLCSTALQRCHPSDPDALPDGPKLLLIGNPNVGKSLLFGCLTNRYVTVSNYPGTTVEITTAKATIAGEPRLVIDTPGTNGLIPQSDDERVARDMLLSSPGAAVLQVGDMSNLRRTILLSLQIAEHNVPFTLCLNMSDEARDRDNEVDPEAIATAIGVPVVGTSALRRWNLERLKREALRPGYAHVQTTYPEAIELGVTRILEVLEPYGGSSRGIALSILAGDETLTPHLPKESLHPLHHVRTDVQSAIELPLSVAIANARVAAVERIVGAASAHQETAHGGWRDKLGIWTMTCLGRPFLLFVLYIAWLFVGNFGAGTLVDLVETKVFNEHLNVWLIHGLDAVAAFPQRTRSKKGSSRPLTHSRALRLAGGRSGSSRMTCSSDRTASSRWPSRTPSPSCCRWSSPSSLFFGVLEDSGYLPRLAVMLQRIFRKMGLNGKAVLPMVLGLGCDTMATLTTRISNEERSDDRHAAARARRPLLRAARRDPGDARTARHRRPRRSGSASRCGTIFLVGCLASKVVPGKAGDFILEIPPMRMPKLSNIAIKVLARTEWYLKEAVPLFIVGTLLLYVPRRAAPAHRDSARCSRRSSSAGSVAGRSHERVRHRLPAARLRCGRTLRDADAPDISLRSRPSSR